MTHYKRGSFMKLRAILLIMALNIILTTLILTQIKGENNNMYVKTTFVEGGEPGISAEVLNNIEDAIESERTFPVAGGTGTAITVTAYHFTLTAGVHLTFIASANNYGAAVTLNVNGLGAKRIYNSAYYMSNPIIASGIAYTVWYDGTDFVLQYINSQEGSKSETVVFVTASRALALTDAGTVIIPNSSSPIVFTILENASVAFPIGSKISFIQYGSGDVSFATSGMAVMWSASSYKKLIGFGYKVELLKIATDTWMLTGDLKA